MLLPARHYRGLGEDTAHVGKLSQTKTGRSEATGRAEGFPIGKGPFELFPTPETGGF